MDEKVLCPGWFQYARNGGCARFFEGQPDEKRYVWSRTQIKNILKDETYIGNTVHHRQGTVSYMMHSMRMYWRESNTGRQEPFKMRTGS
nr:recombinase family protein [uncultured Acetatifactor sp.]